MLIIGLTGGIGSGKSMVAAMFASLGIGIVDTDVIAHALVKPDGPCYDMIIDHFGRDVLRSDGTLNRPWLRELIFQNPDEKRWLEQLLHPLIRDEVLKNITTLSSPYCLVVIPLLAETYDAGAYRYLNRILVIDCTIQQQIERAMKRDSLSKDIVESIINAQAKRGERLKLADDIIENDKDIAHVREQVALLHRKYLALSESVL